MASVQSTTVTRGVSIVVGRMLGTPEDKEYVLRWKAVDVAYLDGGQAAVLDGPVGRSEDI